MAGRRAFKAFLRGLARWQAQCGQCGAAAILLKQGVWFEGRAESDDYPDAKRWRKENRPRSKQCYFNAQMYCLDDRKARYFEGYAVGQDHGHPYPHAWVVMPDDRVIDFTLEAMERQAKREGDACDTRQTLYFGVEVPRRFVAETIAATGFSESMAGKYFI